MSDLIDFLRVQLDEDEALARQTMWAGSDNVPNWTAPSNAIINTGGWDIMTGDRCLNPHILRHDPARVLADVTAKRKIVEALESSLESQALDADDRCYECGTKPLMLLRLLALPYADHPDYREEWRP